MISEKNKADFFRQSSWMMFATTAGGVFMYAVHFVVMPVMPGPEYAIFATLLQILNLLMIPALGLQTVFTQQTASVTNKHEEDQLSATVQALFRWTFTLWATIAALCLIVQSSLIEFLKLTSFSQLWITLLTGLPILWLPIASGLLQGQQNFLWLGWSAIISGFGRFVAVVIIVVLFRGGAGPAMTGALIGIVAALFLALWHTQSIWMRKGSQFEWKPWLMRVVPLTLGLGASQFLLAADMIAVKAHFSDAIAAPYGAAGTIARGLVVFTGPLTAVMFPKIVQSAARSQKSDVLAYAVLATAALAGAVALGCTLLPELPFRILKPEYLPIAPLLPWFVWCMLPLTLTNVLAVNLLGRSDFRVVPWMIGIALCYGIVINLAAKAWSSGPELENCKRIVQTLGAFNLIMLAATAWFTWGAKLQKPTADQG